MGRLFFGTFMFRKEIVRRFSGTSSNAIKTKIWFAASTIDCGVTNG